MPQFCDPPATAVCVSRWTARWRGAALAASVLLLVLLSACDAASALINGSPGKPLTSGVSGDLQRGQRLLAHYQCGSCHAIPGVVASPGNTAAPLDAFGRRSYIAGRIPNSAEALARWIESPAALIPDTPMPAMGVSSDEARDMAAYLGTLR